MPLAAAAAVRLVLQLKLAAAAAQAASMQKLQIWRSLLGTAFLMPLVRQVLAA